MRCSRTISGAARALAAALAEAGTSTYRCHLGTAAAHHDLRSPGGFRRGLEEVSVELPAEAMVAGDFSRESGERATHADVLPDMTAILR